MKMVEAAGVEPASQAVEPAATTCLVRGELSATGLGPDARPAAYSAWVISERTRAVPAPLLTCCSVLHLSRCAVRTSWPLGRESQFFVSFYVLVRCFTRPTNHPRHAASGATSWSKPVRPHPKQNGGSIWPRMQRVKGRLESLKGLRLR